MQTEHLCYLICYKFISNTDTCVIATLQQKKKNCNLDGMNFTHAGYECLSAENNNGYYESCGAIKERNNHNQYSS